MAAEQLAMVPLAKFLLLLVRCLYPGAFAELIQLLKRCSVSFPSDDRFQVEELADIRSVHGLAAALTPLLLLSLLRQLLVSIGLPCGSRLLTCTIQLVLFLVLALKSKII